jgi:hypothetical protein
MKKMDVLQLVNNVALAVIIGLYLLVFVTMIIRARGEEWRRNEILATKLMDRTVDKLVDAIKEIAKTVTSGDGQKENQKIYPMTQFEMDVDKKIKSDYLDDI